MALCTLPGVVHTTTAPMPRNLLCPVFSVPVEALLWKTAYLRDGVGCLEFCHGQRTGDLPREETGRIFYFRVILTKASMCLKQEKNAISIQLWTAETDLEEPGLEWTYTITPMVILMFMSCLSIPERKMNNNGALGQGLPKLLCQCCCRRQGPALGAARFWETSLSFLCPVANLDTHQLCQVEGQQGTHWYLLQPWKTFGHPGNVQISEKCGRGVKSMRYEGKSGWAGSDSTEEKHEAYHCLLVSWNLFVGQFEMRTRSNLYKRQSSLALSPPFPQLVDSSWESGRHHHTMVPQLGAHRPSLSHLHWSWESLTSQEPGSHVLLLLPAGQAHCQEYAGRKMGSFPSWFHPQWRISGKYFRPDESAVLGRRWDAPGGVNVQHSGKVWVPTSGRCQLIQSLPKSIPS